MDGGAWWATVHGVAKSRTRLSDFTFTHWRRKWQPTLCSCLENPGDRGAWWAAVSGVAQSGTRLKRLSSSSSSSRTAVTKVPQTGWLETTGMCSLTVLESESLKPSCWQGWFHFRGIHGESIPACPLASSGFWQSLLSLGL